MIALLDYGAGNIRSVRNAISKLGYSVKNVSTSDDISSCDTLVFPGVGSFGAAMDNLRKRKFAEPVRRHILNGKPFLGICLGLQTLFEYSEESPGIQGLAIIKGSVKKFDVSQLSVPHIGWNGIKQLKDCSLLSAKTEKKFYFDHSYFPVPNAEDKDWIFLLTDYGVEFVSGVQRGNTVAVQFHPEKSGTAGLEFLRNFLGTTRIKSKQNENAQPGKTKLAKRIIACLDVRTNDSGQLVVTKGNQYNVREKGNVRNLGNPIELARYYFEQGADEITFLNITSFREFPLSDIQMLKVLEETSKNVFVPLAIGGGIRTYLDSTGKRQLAIDIASKYFRAGADKICIASDAVYAAEEFIASGQKTGSTSIEQISNVYGRQAVVISIDPRRVYVSSPQNVKYHTIQTETPGPAGEQYCWYQCTVKGGRENRNIDALHMAKACEQLGAGEILLNCIDKDGTGSGFDVELIRDVSSAVGIPVIASSGAGKVEHFSELFRETNVEAALAAGILHKQEVSVEQIKKHLRNEHIEIRDT